MDSDFYLNLNLLRSVQHIAVLVVLVVSVVSGQWLITSHLSPLYKPEMHSGLHWPALVCTGLWPHY